MINWNPLQANDTVALTCPGSICLDPKHPELTQAYLAKHYQLNACFDQETIQPMPAEKRAKIFLKYLLDDDIRLIACLRGGEGSADILPYLHQHQDAIKQLTPKPMIGFSDITAVLNYFAKHYDWPVIHGPSPLHFVNRHVDQASEKMAMDLLFGRSNPVISDFTALNALASAEQTISATLTGGCLSVLAISIKDIWEINTDTKIVMIEDVGEKSYQIMRNLKYFSRIGLFDNVKAIIFGDFTCDPIGDTPEQQERHRLSILKQLRLFAEEQIIPVLHTQSFGHGHTNLPFVFNAPYELRLGDAAKLIGL